MRGFALLPLNFHSKFAGKKRTPESTTNILHPDSDSEHTARWSSMTTPVDATQAQRQQSTSKRYPFPPSPPSSADVTARSTPRIGGTSALDTIEYPRRTLTSSPTIRRTPSSRTERPESVFFDTDAETDAPLQRASSALGLDYVKYSPPRRRRSVSLRQKPARALTLPCARPSFLPGLSLHDPPQPLVPRSRSSSSGSSSMSFSPPGHVTQNHQSVPSSSGMSRKVAESLQLFKETASTPTEETSHIPLGQYSAHHSKKRGTSKASLLDSEAVEEEGSGDNDEAEAEYEFVARSEWPDRETAALRREKSSTALERVRTRESVSSVGGTRDRERDRSERYGEQAFKERRASMKENIVSDLAQWSKDISAAVQAANEGPSGLTRGRPHKRPSWKDSTPLHKVDSASSALPTSSSSASPASISSAKTYQDQRHISHEPSSQSPLVRPLSKSTRHAYPSPSLSPSKRSPQLPAVVSSPSIDRSTSDNLSTVPVSACQSTRPVVLPTRPDEAEVSTPVQSIAPLVIPHLHPRFHSPSPTDYAPVTPTPAPTPFFTDEDEDEFDFDSEWDSASVTTSASTRTSPPPASPDVPLGVLNGSQSPAVASGLDEDGSAFNRYDRASFRDRESLERSRTFSPAIRPRVLTTFREEDSSSGKLVRTEGSDTEYLDDLELDGHLPHIPLRPFRNQVGGHSAIYKFTKRAVCKVSVFSCLLDFSFNLFSHWIVDHHFGYCFLINPCGEEAKSFSPLYLLEANVISVSIHICCVHRIPRDRVILTMISF